MKVNFTFVFLVPFIVLMVFVSRTATANLKEGQSFRPITWEQDFVRSNSLAFTAIRLLPGAQIVTTPERTVDSAYGLQLGQNLRDDWMGRISLFFGQTGAREGEYMWSFLGSDLVHPLVSTDLLNHAIFQMIRPMGFFGLGMTSRWQRMSLNLNLIPTLRFEASEPIAYAGAYLVAPMTDELMASFEYRFMQSARNSRTRGNVFGVSLVWGRLAK